MIKAVKISDYMSPKYWPGWLFLGFMYLVSFLPLPIIVFIGRHLGNFLALFLPERKKISEINIRIAFPEASDTEINRLVKTSIENIGVAVFEMAMAWWQQKKLFSLCQVEGLENLQLAQTSSRGIMILSAHFTCVEIGGPLINHYAPIYVMFKHAKNKLFDAFTKYHRESLYAGIVDHRKPANMIRALKKGYAAWYLPDQNLSSRDAMFVPFFSIDASTLSSTSRIAKITQAKVVPYIIKRNSDNRSYTLKFLPALENFPSDDIQQDTLRINQVLEQLIVQNPEQYLWAHKRYKNRPEGQASLYPGKKS